MYLLSFGAPLKPGISCHLCCTGLSSVYSSGVTAWSQTMRHSTEAESSSIHLIHQHIMLFWRSNILPFLREFKIDFHLSGPHPEPIKKRQTCSLWSVGFFILWLIGVGSQSPLRMWIIDLLHLKVAGFLTSSIICKPIIDLNWLQFHVLSQSLLQTQVQGEIKGQKSHPNNQKFPFSSKSSPAKDLPKPETFIH